MSQRNTLSILESIKNKINNFDKNRSNSKDINDKVENISNDTALSNNEAESKTADILIMSNIDKSQNNDNIMNSEIESQQTQKEVLEETNNIDATNNHQEFEIDDLDDEFDDLELDNLAQDSNEAKEDAIKTSDAKELNNSEKDSSDDILDLSDDAQSVDDDLDLNNIDLEDESQDLNIGASDDLNLESQSEDLGLDNLDLSEQDIADDDNSDSDLSDENELDLGDMDLNNELDTASTPDLEQNSYDEIQLNLEEDLLDEDLVLEENTNLIDDNVDTPQDELNQFNGLSQDLENIDLGDNDSLSSEENNIIQDSQEIVDDSADLDLRLDLGEQSLGEDNNSTDIDSNPLEDIDTDQKLDIDNNDTVENLDLSDDSLDDEDFSLPQNKSYEKNLETLDQEFENVAINQDHSEQELNDLDLESDNDQESNVVEKLPSYNGQDSSQNSMIYESTLARTSESLQKLTNAKNLISQASNVAQNQDMQRLAAQIMEPKLEKWINDNLPDIVEKIVQQEISKIVPKD